MAELFGRRVASVGTRVAVPVLVAASALAITPGVAGAAVSNGAIAYLRPGPAGGQDIWTINPDGTGARRLIADADRLRYSPGGDRILFVRTVNAVPRLVLANPDGTARKSVAGTWTSGDWSPDGTRLVTTAQVGGHSELFVRPVAAGVATQLTHQGDQGCEARDPDWGPRGLVFVTYCPRSTFPVAISGKVEIHLAQLPARRLVDDSALVSRVSNFVLETSNQFVRQPRWNASGEILFTGCIWPPVVSRCNGAARYNVFKVTTAGVVAPLSHVPDDQADTGYTHAVPAPTGRTFVVSANLPQQKGIQVFTTPRLTLDPLGQAVQDWQPLGA